MKPIDITTTPLVEPQMFIQMYRNPLDEHLATVVNKTWNFAKRIKDYEGHLQNAAMGLAAEGAEVLDIVKKQVYHTEGVDYTEKMKHELGDVCFYLAKMLELTGLTLEEVLAANKEKLASRHPELGQVEERFSGNYIR
jgi:NTP pyrophosphatase (non-canonical NTP hydrolase)